MAELKNKLDPRGLVLDDDLRSCIVRAHAGAEMPDDAVVCIVLGPPITVEDLRMLRTACKERFGADLPADYIAFLREHDGLNLAEVSPEDAVRMARDPSSFRDHSVMSSVLVRDWLGSVFADVTCPDGSVVKEGPRLLPFYDMVETGCHAFDYGATDASPRILDVEGERLWERAGHDVLAPSFSVWFEAFLKAGLEPFATKSLLSAASRL